jgi:hypothetical protein
MSMPGAVDKKSSVKNTSGQSMTAVIDIPDELYQKVAARVASLGLRVPDVTVELYERWLSEESSAVSQGAGQSYSAQWLENWFREADAAISKAPDGASAREILVRDRNRLESP